MSQRRRYRYQSPLSGAKEKSTALTPKDLLDDPLRSGQNRGIRAEYSQNYPASAWSPATGDDALSGSLFVRQFSVAFEGEELKLEFPFQELEIAPDEEDKEKIYFLHPRFPDAGIYTYSPDVLNHPSLNTRTDLRKQIENAKYVREGPTQHSKRVYGVLVGAVALILLLWLGNNAIIAFVANRLPASLEDDIGESVMAEVEDEFDFVDDPAYTNYLAAVAARLKAGLPDRGREIKFYVLDSEMVNAFAVPGGHVLVARGLIDHCDSAEEVAAVLAHELAHVSEKHVMRQVVSRAGPFVALNYMAGQRSSVLTALAATASFLGDRKYSRQHEFEADEIGFNYLVAANIDPQGAITFYKKLDELEGGRSSAASFLSSHPPTPERISRLLERKRTLGSKKWKSFGPLSKPIVEQESRRDFLLR